MAYILTFGNTG